MPSGAARGAVIEPNCRAQFGAVADLPLAGWARYQAWVPPQWGQSTEVETKAWNTNPQWHA